LAAKRGKALLLEKPLGPDLRTAQYVADTIAEAGVVSQLVLTKRYHPTTRAFLDAARSLDIAGARSCYLHGAFLGGDFATGWRLEHGALLDLGPHLLDLLDAAIGPIAAIRSTGDPRHWIEITCEHANGAVSQASLSGSVNLPRAVTRVELFGSAPSLVYDTAAIDHEEGWPILRRDFATAVRTHTPTELDAQHGLYLQSLIDRAAQQ
jgi:predicted dehydrogenase